LREINVTYCSNNDQLALKLIQKYVQFYVNQITNEAAAAVRGCATIEAAVVRTLFECSNYSPIVLPVRLTDLLMKLKTTTDCNRESSPQEIP
jgi:hypothetical protein